MPVSQNPEENYQHYCLSQRRVERWVQETEKQLQHAAAAAPPPVESQRQRHRSTDREPHSLPSPPAQAAGDADARPPTRTSHRSSSAKPHRTDAVSRSRSRPSSGSKKISSDGKKRRRRAETPLALSTYLPYGLLPLLFAVTGTTVVSVLFAVVLLAGYIASAMEDSGSSSSSRKHSKRP